MKRPQIVHLVGKRAVAFEEFGARFGVVAELLVQEKTVLLVAEPLQEIIADWHLVEVCVV